MPETGESDIREDLSSGNGVYKSIDGGATWNHIGLEDTRQISRIVIDPQNPNIVYVGALGHAYGPALIAPTSSAASTNPSMEGRIGRGFSIWGQRSAFSDLAIGSSARKILFAGAWHTRRPPWSAYAPIDGPGGGLYRSQDGGKTWARVNVNGAGNGLPEGDGDGFGVDVAPDGKRVYALIEVAKSEAGKSEAKKVRPLSVGRWRQHMGAREC